MSDERSEHQLPPAASSTVEPALQTASSGNSQHAISISAGQQSHSSSLPSADIESTFATADSRSAPTDTVASPRRLSNSSAADMQLDSNSQYSIGVAGYPPSHSGRPHRNALDRTHSIGPAAANEPEARRPSDDSENLRRSLSSTSLSRQAQFTFSAPSHNNAAAVTRVDPGSPQSRSPSYVAEAS
ncbi:hypothetical protein IWW55_004657, partial [Coemansia sp. RSA 2706]